VIQAPAPTEVVQPARRRVAMFSAVAVILLAITAGILYLARNRPAPVPEQTAAAMGIKDLAIAPDIPLRQVAVDPRTQNLAQPIPVEDERWLESVRPQNRDIFNQLRLLMRQGRIGLAVSNAAPLGEQDPALEMLFAVGLYAQKDVPGGYNAMLRSEAMSPRNTFRCWAMMQCALIVGDMATVERETEHLAGDLRYAKKAKELLAKAKAQTKG